MNIKEAKEQIKYAMTAYFAKDEAGMSEIPREEQRPVFLLGPPGIGKTAVMAQIASELGVLLVSYSMTHHTRQSALGLPFIAEKTYQGVTFSVSEYTMSEIIASVYEAMEETGIREGILFLDEINCVSETLTPSMLQFLQFKTFGRHALPDGWIVVTAGNPPEYNRTVREFDIATLDRIKKIEVEPDFDAWKEYAWKTGVHPAVISYLEIKKNHFYSVETSAKGKSFVTARGWGDLSRIMTLNEKKGLPVDGKLISQYLQNDRIAADFAAYYDLFAKYRSDYEIRSILHGTEGADIRARAKNAGFDERIALIGLIISALSDLCGDIAVKEKCLVLLLDSLKNIRAACPDGTTPEAFGKQLGDEANRLSSRIDMDQKGAALTREEKKILADAAAFLMGSAGPDSSFSSTKARYEEEVRGLTAAASGVSEALANAFAFLDAVYPGGQEMILFVTELTVNERTANFISHYGSKDYEKKSRDLLFHERGRDIEARLKKIDLTGL